MRLNAKTFTLSEGQSDVVFEGGGGLEVNHSVGFVFVFEPHHRSRAGVSSHSSSSLGAPPVCQHLFHGSRYGVQTRCAACAYKITLGVKCFTCSLCSLDFCDDCRWVPSIRLNSTPPPPCSKSTGSELSNAASNVSISHFLDYTAHIKGTS